MEPLETAEARVLGALIEKEATTPEYYPLSLNALVNACNQKSNRFPVVDYDEETVRNALEGLKRQRLAAVIIGNGRVQKFAQRMSETLNMGRREMAVLCTLLLRGPQTLGEIKDRSERIFAFGDLEETERVLEKLAETQWGAMAKKLPRQPGQKEARFAHLLSGEPAAEPESDAAAYAQAPTRVAQLENELAALRSEVSELRGRLENLERQLT